MTERETLRAILEAVRYLEKDAELVGADSVAMYLRLAASEADTLIKTMPKPPESREATAAKRRKSAPPE
ncbi:hypothetical protein [Iodidimonas sp. SYSU 1G8]|uniref:hypothetical protein n=1 Tax=Iodidimonas sp. SYSU 1G8 TaxID=3133967 RepID=UPI0031FEF3DE